MSTNRRDSAAELAAEADPKPQQLKMLRKPGATRSVSILAKRGKDDEKRKRVEVVVEYRRKRTP
jgi:hypothetical protein